MEIRARILATWKEVFSENATARKEQSPQGYALLPPRSAVIFRGKESKIASVAAGKTDDYKPRLGNDATR